VVVTGDCDPCSPSDGKFKKNVLDLEGALEKILALRPKSYNMRTEEFRDRISLASNPQFGLIAEDVETVLPEIIHHVVAPPKLNLQDGSMKHEGEPLEFKALNYKSLVPLLISAMQEQQARIEALEAQLGR
jgi:hypothetical protein